MDVVDFRTHPAIEHSDAIHSKLAAGDIANKDLLAHKVPIGLKFINNFNRKAAIGIEIRNVLLLSDNILRRQFSALYAEAINSK